jgi:hypothetical protein
LTIWGRKLPELRPRSTAAELERICRMYRKVISPAEAQEADSRRYVSCRETDDGMVVLTARLHPDEAARVMEALRVSAETRCEVDGLCALAESALRGDKTERPATEVVVRVDSATLEGRFDDGTGVSAETARRLLCDAGVVPVLMDEQGNALDVGPRQLSAPVAPAVVFGAKGFGTGAGETLVLATLFVTFFCRWRSISRMVLRFASAGMIGR